MAKINPHTKFHLNTSTHLGWGACTNDKTTIVKNTFWIQNGCIRKKYTSIFYPLKQ